MRFGYSLPLHVFMDALHPTVYAVPETHSKKSPKHVLLT